MNEMRVVPCGTCVLGVLQEHQPSDIIDQLGADLELSPVTAPYQSGKNGHVSS
jgi:hypothetical protein